MTTTLTDIAEDLRRWLLELRPEPTAATIGEQVAAVCQNRVPQQYDGPYLWFRRSDSEDELGISERGGRFQFYEEFDLEAVAHDDDGGLDLAQELVAIVKLHNQTGGALGLGTVQGIFIANHSDQYRPENVSSDDGRHVATIEIQLMGYQPGEIKDGKA